MGYKHNPAGDGFLARVLEAGDSLLASLNGKTLPACLQHATKQQAVPRQDE